jgi:hypothetical protein
MLTKNDEKVKGTVTGNVKTPNSPSPLFFKRERAVSCPLTRSTTLTATEENREVMGPPLSRRVFTPDSMFDKDAYDLIDTGLPGFKGLISTRNRVNNSVKSNTTPDTGTTQLAHSDSETECSSPRM